MKKKLLTRFGVTVLLLALAGCSDVTAPKLITSFEWGEMEDPETVVEGITTSVALGELFILGQIKTPARCYNLDHNFNRNGKDLILSVTATRTSTPNCDETIGGFRYTFVASNLKYDTYDLRATHTVTNAAGGVYTATVTIR
jgi:hypothetical protein